jgi:hypothetical protein
LGFERAGVEKSVGFLGEIVALGFFRADVEQADRGIVALENVFGENARHHPLLVEVFRLGRNIRADVKQHTRTLQGWHDRGDAGAADAFEE